MKKTLKKGLLALCAVTATLCTSLSVGAIASAGETTVTGKSIDEVTFTMVNGASIRADSFGIRFSATMSEADYTALDAYYEEEIEFGTFIMAANYKTAVSKGTFEESHFFGDYDADETTSSLYTWDGASVSENRVKILQMDSKIYYDEEWQTMRINGSVTSVYDHNLDMDYVGISYIKVGNEYRLATQGDNARSVVYVAQLAIEANKKAEDVTAGSSVLTHYTTEVEEAVKTVNYTVNTYLHDEENGAVKYDTTVVENHPLNEKAEVTNIAESINGYTYVASRSTTSGVAYIGDKLVLELYYHKKADGVLYDFYDKTEASKISATSATSTYTEFLDQDVTSFTRTAGSAWNYTNNIGTALNTAFLDSEKETIDYVDYVYLNVYASVPSGSATVYMYFYKWNGTTWVDSSNAHFSANAWTTLQIPVPDTTTTFSGMKFTFVRKVSGSWQPLGKTEGDTVYINEIGVMSDTVVYDYNGLSDLTHIFSGDTATGYTDEQDINCNTNYVYKGDYSLRLHSLDRYSEYNFTTSFYNWLVDNNVKSFSFKVYAQSTETCKLDKIQGAGGIADDVYNGNVTNNTWLTVTIKVANMTESSVIAFNKSVNNTTMNIYIDNFTFTYNS
ncbi:MAG: hypothetical protein IJW58_02205 [Clostridia bacterium]|nr:hypothetical protein [Clostridia bacterium]